MRQHIPAAPSRHALGNTPAELPCQYRLVGCTCICSICWCSTCKTHSTLAIPTDLLGADELCSGDSIAESTTIHCQRRV